MTRHLFCSDQDVYLYQEGANPSSHLSALDTNPTFGCTKQGMDLASKFYII
jgi:hypothetical protein